MNQININLSQLVENGRSYHELMRIVEPALLCELLRQTNGNKSLAAKIAGLDRRTLSNKLARYNIVLTPSISACEVAK